jgi:hypothetical protein
MRKPSSMKRIIAIFLLFTTAMIFSAGCVQSPGTSPAVPAVSAAPAEEPAQPAPATAGTLSAGETRPVITVVHYIPVVKTMKDSDLLLALQVPQELGPVNPTPG